MHLAQLLIHDALAALPPLHAVRGDATPLPGLTLGPRGPLIVTAAGDARSVAPVRVNLPGMTAPEPAPVLPPDLAPPAPEPARDTGPVRDRALLPDVLRGVALLGILIVNMQDFAGFLEWQQVGVDRAAQVVTDVFANGRFISIFAMLFGWGAAGILARRGAGVFLRRHAALLVVGRCITRWCGTGTSSATTRRWRWRCCSWRGCPRGRCWAPPVRWARGGWDWRCWRPPRPPAAPGRASRSCRTCCPRTRRTCRSAPRSSGRCCCRATCSTARGWWRCSAWAPPLERQGC